MTSLATVAPADERPWLKARWGKRHGNARRYHRQPFRWTTLYEFIPDDGEAVVLSGEVLNLGVTHPERHERELDKRKGPVFHAILKGRRGVARAIPGSPYAPSITRWDFLGHDGMLQTIADPALQVFQCWGDAEAFNVWKAWVSEEARKSKRREAAKRWSKANTKAESNGEDE